MRQLHKFEIERNALALRIGTDLPKPRKLTVAKPGFALGSCERLHFSPSGAHLIATTANGTFLWELDSGTRVLKLVVPSNPTEVVFDTGGTQALFRNEQGQFVRLSLPDGAVLAKFKAKYQLRLDGTPALGPQNRVLQLAYEGRLLELDGNDGTVNRQFQLDASGYTGEIHWFPLTGCWIISQCSRSVGRGRDVPCALWRWDVDAPAPIRLPGKWDRLTTARAPTGDAVLMHHIVEPDQPLSYVLERFDLATAETAKLGALPGSIISLPSLAHDGYAFGARSDDGPYIDIGGQALQLPCYAHLQFHPTRDLVGISGQAAFVAPRAALAQQVADLKVWQLERELSGRGYGRLSTLGGTMPARLIVFAKDGEWLIQAERIEGRRYAPLADSVVVSDQDSEALQRAIDTMRVRSRAGVGTHEPATASEYRPFHGGAITPPSAGWTRAAAVGFSADAVDVWPLKPSGALAFSHEHYPVAALAHDIEPNELISGIRNMLAWFKPRRQ